MSIDYKNFDYMFDAFKSIWVCTDHSDIEISCYHIERIVEWALIQYAHAYYRYIKLTDYPTSPYIQVYTPTRLEATVKRFCIGDDEQLKSFLDYVGEFETIEAFKKEAFTRAHRIVDDKNTVLSKEIAKQRKTEIYGGHKSFFTKIECLSYKPDIKSDVLIDTKIKDTSNAVYYECIMYTLATFFSYKEFKDFVYDRTPLIIDEAVLAILKKRNYRRPFNSIFEARNSAPLETFDELRPRIHVDRMAFSYKSKRIVLIISVTPPKTT